MERYMVDGQPFDVAPHRLDDFLKMYPNASKVQDVEKTIDVAEQDAPVASQTESTASKSEDPFSDGSFRYDNDSGRTLFIPNDKTKPPQSIRYQDLPKEVKNSILEGIKNQDLKEDATTQDLFRLFLANEEERLANQSVVDEEFDIYNTRINLPEPTYNADTKQAISSVPSGATVMGPDGEMMEIETVVADQVQNTAYQTYQKDLGIWNREQNFAKNSTAQQYLDMAMKSLESKKAKDGTEYTQDQVQKLAKQLYTEQLNQDVFNKKISEYLNDNQKGIVKDDWQNNWSEEAIAELETIPERTEQNFINLEGALNELTEFDNSLKVEQQKLKTLGDDLTEKGKRINDQLNALGEINENSSPEDIALYNSLISELKLLQDNDYQDYLIATELYNDRLNQRDKLYRSYEYFANEAVDLQEDGSNLRAFIDATGRNQHMLAQMAAYTTNSLLEIGQGIEEVIYRVNPVNILADVTKEYYNNDKSAMPDFVKHMVIAQETYNIPRTLINQSIDLFQEDLLSSVRLQTNYEDVNDLASFGEYFGGLIANQAPQLALMYATGGASLYVLAGSAAGQKFKEMEEARALGADYSLGDMYFAAGFSGIAEYASERVTLGLVNKTKGVFNTNLIYKDGIGEAYKKIFNVKNLVAGAKDINQEGVSEVLAQMGNNFADMAVGNKNVTSLFDGIDAAYVSGTLIGQSIKSPGVFKQMITPFLSSDINGKIANLNVQRKDIETQLANPSLSAEVRARLQDKLVAVVAKQSDLVNQTIDIVDDMSVEDKESLIDLSIERKKLEDQARSISNDNSLSQESKNKLLEGVREDLNELDTKKEKIINPYKAAQQEAMLKPRVEELGGTLTSMNRTQIMDAVQEDIQVQERIIQQANDVLNQGLSNDAPQVQQALQDLNLATAKLNDLKNADNKFGFIKEKADGSFEIIVNKDKPKFGTASHEFLHKVLSKTLKGNSKLQTQVGNALTSFVNKNKGGFSQAFIDRMSAYQNPETGELDAEFGEETITVMSESIMDGTLEYNENIFTKLGDIIRQTLQRLGMKIKLDTGRDVYNFIKDYNKSIEKGYSSKALVDMTKRGAEGRLLDPKAEAKDPKAKFSKDQVYQRVEAMKDKLVNPDTKEVAAIEIAYELQNEIERRMQFLEGVDISEIALEFMTSDSNRGLRAILKKYDPNKNDSIMGYLNGFVPGTGRSLMDVRLQEFYENDPRYSNIIQSTTEEATGRQVENRLAEETIEETERRIKLTVLADRLGVSSQVAQAIEAANIDENALISFKKVPNAVAEVVGNMLGISPKKIKSKANLTAAEVASAQRWFNKNAALVVQALPQGFDSEGKATGVPKTVLEALYNKRSSRAKTKAGLKTQVKRTDILDSELLALVDIVDGVPTRNRNTSARIIALADLLGKVMTNQQLRINNPALTRISDGMSPVMFSKDNNQDKKGVKAGWPVLARLYGYDRLDVSTEQGRDDMINWIKATGSTQLPFSFFKTVFQGSGAINESIKDSNGNQIYLDKDNNRVPTKTGKKLRRYTLRDGRTMLNDNPQFDSNEVTKLLIPESKKHLFASVPQMMLELEGVDFIEETDALEALGKRKNYGKYNNEWAQKFWNKDSNQKFLEDSEIGFTQAWLTIQENIQESSNKKFWAAILESTSVGQNNFVRINSKYGFHNTLNLENTEEHASPATEHAQILWSLANDGVLTEGLLQQMNENFVQGALPKIFDDLLGPYKDKIPEEYHEGVMFGVIPYWIRYINPVINKQKYTLNGKTYSGINPNVITLPGNITLAEAYNLGVNKALHMNQDIISMQQDLLFEVFRGEMTQAEAKSKLSNFITRTAVKPLTEIQSRQANADKAYAIKFSKAPSRGMSTFDFDETLIIDGKNFVTATKDGETVRIPSDRWPIDGPKYSSEGWNFDFSDFVNVRGGKEGPLLQKMKNQIKKYGNKNVFVLTARMQEAAEPIHQWLKSKGINIPLENITGLGKSEGDAKAAWFLQKYAEGYNDMYFVDDALPNVEAVKHVFDQLDIKGKSVQARIKFSKDINVEFNQMLERTKGVGAQKIFSRVEARKRGKNIGGFTLFVPPSAEDFTGLLRYFVGKGKQGDADIKFFEEALVKPFAKADREMSSIKTNIRDQYKALRKKFPDVRKKLGKLTDVKGFTFDAAIRVYLYDKAGYDIPGLADNAKRELSNLVKKDPDLRAFADGLGALTKQTEGYVEPVEGWDMGNIAMDLQEITNKVSRSQFLQEWVENKNIIFSQENLNKIEAVYGSNFRSALEDILYRMETGQNRRKGRTSFENKWNNWINSSVGAIMFFNARSAVLQTLSTVNFINFEDNNIFAASRAFANQPQYWKDFTFLFNSDFLKNRRAGLATNVNEAELANAVAGAKNKAMAALRYLLKKGFTPTQAADSFAIAAGGATYYRNRVKKYLKEGRSQQEAENQAMLDFREIAEETQQSARPDRISQQQASNLGRIILAFANTPMQYNRLIKKAAGDLINKRGDWRSNLSRILYYGAAQNFIFASLQNALFAMAFTDEEDENKEEIKEQRILNSMLDSLLRGSGIGGAALATIKNVILEYKEQDEKGFRADYGQVIVEGLNVSPPLGSKARKLYSAMTTRKYNKKAMKHMSMLDYDNPAWLAIGNVVEATTNLPMARAIRKMDNLREAMNQDNTNLQRLFLALGWSSWDLNVGEKVVRNEGKDDEYTVFLDERRQAVEKAEQEIKEKEKETKLKEKYPGKSEEEIKKTVELEQKNKQIFDLNKKQQVKILEDNNLNPKNYPKEKDRVEAIMNLREENKEKIDSTLTAIKEYVPTKEEQRSIELFKMTKKDQINLLMELGVSSKVISSLKYEEDRVKKIMQLQEKVKK